MKILVTLDGSEFSKAALVPASKLATEAESEVHLLSVLNDHEMETQGNAAQKLLDAEASAMAPLKV